MDCYCDYDAPEFYYAEIRKARTEHKCSECFSPIHKGERYEHVLGKWDGDVSTFDTCDRCLALKEYVEAHVPCFCWTHGHVREDALDTAREYDIDAPGLLFGAYRREVLIRGRMRERAGLQPDPNSGGKTVAILGQNEAKSG